MVKTSPVWKSHPKLCWCLLGLGIVLLLLLVGLAVGLTRGGGADRDPGSTSIGLPATEHFDIRYTNSTKTPITIWFEGSQPPCSLLYAKSCNTWSETPSEYRAKWLALAKTFQLSGTRFRVATYASDGKSVYTVDAPVLNSVDLDPGQVLIITTPMSATGQPEWRFANVNGSLDASPIGVKSWTTPKGVQMPASQRVALFEYNLNTDGKTYWDLSAVDGVNIQATMSVGNDTSKISTDIHNCMFKNNAYKTCENLKFQDAKTFNATNVFEANSIYCPYWIAANKPSNKELAEAANGDPTLKAAYHIYWKHDPQAQEYIKWLQRDNKGNITTNAYCWAYDEMTLPDNRPIAGGFDKNFTWDGNPTNNSGQPNNNVEVKANVVTSYKKGVPLLVNITDIIHD